MIKPIYLLWNYHLFSIDKIRYDELPGNNYIIASAVAVCCIFVYRYWILWYTTRLQCIPIYCVVLKTSDTVDNCQLKYSLSGVPRSLYVVQQEPVATCLCLACGYKVHSDEQSFVFIPCPERLAQKLWLTTFFFQSSWIFLQCFSNMSYWICTIYSTFIAQSEFLCRKTNVVNSSLMLNMNKYIFINEYFAECCVLFCWWFYKLWIILACFQFYFNNTGTKTWLSKSICMLSHTNFCGKVFNTWGPYSIESTKVCKCISWKNMYNIFQH